MRTIMPTAQKSVVTPHSSALDLYFYAFAGMSDPSVAAEQLLELLLTLKVRSMKAIYFATYSLNDRKQHLRPRAAFWTLSLLLRMHWSRLWFPWMLSTLRSSRWVLRSINDAIFCLPSVSILSKHWRNTALAPASPTLWHPLQAQFPHQYHRQFPPVQYLLYRPTCKHNIVAIHPQLQLQRLLSIHPPLRTIILILKRQQPLRMGFMQGAMAHIAIQPQE